MAKPAQSIGGMFPAKHAPTPSGMPVLLKVGPAAADTLTINPVTFLSRPGTNAGEGSKSMCGLIIASIGHPAQGVITVGTGTTEATPSCDAVLAMGAVPAAHGERTRRLGIIHAVSSGSAANGRTAVVLRRGTDGMWAVDEAGTARADTITHYTIAELRRKLR
ncbi:MAG: hypothetical protein ACRYG4_01985 [Janthinobacterium lividum]